MIKQRHTKKLSEERKCLYLRNNVHLIDSNLSHLAMLNMFECNLCDLVAITEEGSKKYGESRELFVGFFTSLYLTVTRRVTAHLIIDTPKTGENEALSSHKPTLKEFLSQELGENADQIYHKLCIELSITDIDSIIFTKEDHLEQLCELLQLTFVEKLKFTAGVRKLELLFNRSFVTISKQEQNTIDRLNLELKKATDTQQTFEQYFDTIDEHLSSLKSQINTEIANAITLLQDRKKLIYKQLDEWKLQKIEDINRQIVRVVEYRIELSSTKQNIYALLESSDALDTEKRDNQDRAEQIAEITNCIFSNNGDKYKSFQDDELLKQYIQDNTSMIDVGFDNDQIISYGELTMIHSQISTNISSNNTPKGIDDDEMKTSEYEFFDKEFVYKYDYDKNGIIYFIGTNYGRQRWQNPGITGKIKLDSSGWSFYGSIYDMVGRRSCDSHCSDIKNSWILFDFGDKIRLKPTKYTLRHSTDENGYYMKMESFGSKDNQSWMLFVNILKIKHL